MMQELPEARATGELAVIYEELRTTCAVPYVSSLQRHLATMPGCLEYAWALLRPAFVSGLLPETAWRLASMMPVAPLPPLTPEALRLLGVDAAGMQAIRNICDNFVRVAPINLLFAGAVERALEGAEATGEGAAVAWSPPEPLAPMPAMVDLEQAGADLRSVLLGLGTEIGRAPFVPGLYRLLACWPGYLAHVAALLTPLLRSEMARAERAAIASNIMAAADDILAAVLPTDRPPPSAAQAQAIRGAIHTYRVTSSEMIVFGTLLRDALPPEGEEA